MNRPHFNPALLTDDQLRTSFVVRQAELDELIRTVRNGSQHMLVLGWRGMGKTMLLHRLALRVRHDDPDLAATWLPVLFDEEQYNLGDLADFWLNTLRMVSAASGDRRWRDQADALARHLDGPALEEAARLALREASQVLGRRLLLLVDNFDEVVARIDGDVEQARLREVLQHEPWMLLIGASSRAIEATYDYDQPLYQQFGTLELRPLDVAPSLLLLESLAAADGEQDRVDELRRDQARIRKFTSLVGGNPRTLSLLYDLWKGGAPAGARASIEALLDAHTSLYKDRMERLAPQAQRVLDALAQRWEATTAEDLAQELRLSRAPVSAQLTRLYERGLLDRVDVGSRAQGYQIRERFFNLWCLMRGSRRSRARLRWLAEWLDLFYVQEDAPKLAADAQTALAEAAPEGLTSILEWASLIAQRLPGQEAAQTYEAAFLAANRHGVGVQVGIEEISRVLNDPSITPAQRGPLALLAADHAGDNGKWLRYFGLSDEALVQGTFDAMKRAYVYGHSVGVVEGQTSGILWSILAILAHQEGRIHDLRALAGPEALPPNDAWRVAMALVMSGHQDAPRLAADLQPETDVPAIAVLAVKVFAGDPGAAAFAHHHELNPNWDRLLAKLYALRGAAAVVRVAAAGARFEAWRSSLVPWVALADLATRPASQVDTREAGPVRPAVLLLQAMQTADAAPLSQIPPEAWEAWTAPATPIMVADDSVGAGLDLLLTALFAGGQVPPSLSDSAWGPLRALSLAAQGAPIEALQAYAAEGNAPWTPVMASWALLRLAAAAHDEATRLDIARHARRLLQQAPGPWQVHAAVARAEIALGRPEPAGIALHDALIRATETDFHHADLQLLELTIQLAALDADRALDVVRRSGVDERWLPLVDALRLQLGDEALRRRLPPERLELAQDALSRLERPGRPS